MEKKLLYILVLLVLVALMLNSLIFFYPCCQVVHAQTTGWLQGWKYRRAVTIYNTANNNTLTDYQVRVVVNTASLISEGKLQGTCADIRFTDSDGQTLLSYWIEPNTCNTTLTRIWVKVPSIPASSTKTIYMYYGNPTATSASNGDNTFIFFDDFTGTSLNTSKWGVWTSDTVGTVKVSNGYLYVSAADYGGWTAAYSLSKINVSSPIAIEIKNLTIDSKSDLGDQGTIFVGLIESLSSTATCISTGRCFGNTPRAGVGEGDDANRYWQIETANGAGYSYYSSVLMWAPGAQLTLSLRILPSIKVVGTYATSTVTLTSRVMPTGNYYVFVGACDSKKGYTPPSVYLDFILIRKYTEPEPIASVSTAEEVQPMIPMIIVAGKPVTLTASFSVAPNDVIAPHLYTWYFDGIDDYVVIPLTVYGWSGITIQQWIYPYHPKAKSTWSKANMIGDYWNDGPAIFYETEGAINYTWSAILFTTRKSDGTRGTYNFQVSAYRNMWVNVAVRFSKTDRVYIGYINGSKVYTATIPSTEATVLEWNPATATKDLYKRFVLGANVYGAENMRMMQGNILIYSRALSDSEVLNICTSNIINASHLVLFLDPTFYNGTHYLDLSGYNNHGVGYNNVSRVPDTRQWLYQVKGLASDGLVHFRFFPVNTRIEVYDSNNNLVTSFIITGTSNQAGLIEDYAVNLPAGDYIIKAYTYLDHTVSQNNGSTRYTHTARYPPGSSLRIMWNDANAVAISYQLSTNPSFTVVNYENTASVTGNYYDIVLPSINNTWYLRVRVQLPNESRIIWSNTVSFRTDYLVISTTVTKTRADLSTGIAITYTTTYTDGSQPPVFNMNVTAVLTQLGVYKPADVWWRVDVYRGATSSSEPPSSDYTYLGTVYPVSTHSYFTSGLSYVPSNYNTAYVFAGVPINEAPYWAKIVGSPNTYFALVYQSMVYLPQTGSYTFQLISNDGARLYINGSLIIDGWSGPGTRSATVRLNAGWYNITVKYYQYSGVLYLLLGVTLPNGTSVNPLVPAYGIQMVPPDSSYNAALPSTPLTLLNHASQNTTATLSLGLGTTGRVDIVLQAMDLGLGFTSNITIPPLVWDQVVVNSFAPSKPRFTVGDPPSFNISAVYAFDDTPFQGSFTLNDTSTKTSVGAYGYSIIRVSDSLYGLTRFSGNITTTAIFDKLLLDSYVFTVNNTAIGNNTRIDYSSSLNIKAVLKHAYDGLVLDSTNAVRVQLAGVNASWNGSAWVATIQPPGGITAVMYSVVSYAESKLGVRFIDPVILFRVIYDSVNATYYASDLAGNTITLRLVYGYDGALVPSGTACINDSGTVVCGSISNGYATLRFNRFTNGTVSFINATDGVFVYTNPVKPNKLAVKWVSGDKRISLVGTVNAYYLNHTELPGYLRLACELKGNASILVNTSLVPVLVKLNGAPASFNYVNGMLLFYGLSSTVEVYYSTPVSAVTLPGAAPVGAVYEIGFADNSTLESSALRIGVLVNGSSVAPFIYYNGSKYYAGGVSGISFPLDVAVSWECSGGLAGVNAMVVYRLGNATYYSVLRSVFNGVNVSSCPSLLYPYLFASGNVTGVVDKYGGLSSEILRYMATHTLRLAVNGPVKAGGLVKFVALASPVRIVYSMGNVYTEPGSGSMLTLVGFKGFTLSYSVAGSSVSNILITGDEYQLDFPRGISLLVIADPSSRTLNLVQVSPVSEPREYMPIPAPGIAVPALPEPQPPVFPGTWDSPAFIVLYGAAVAVAIIATKMTGSVPRGIMVAAMSFGLALLGIGVFTRDFSAVSVALVALVTAVGIEVARRQAG